MNSRDLFKKTHSAYESRQVFDGVYAVSARESGQVAGACASLKAICSPDATDQDLWHVVHLDAGSRLLLDSVAVLGASGQDQAAEWAMQDFGQHMGAVGVIGVASGSAIALRRVLDDGLQRGRVTQALLDSAGSRVTAHPVRWLDGVGIASHGGSMATLFLDMVRHDEDGLLLDAMTPADLMEGAEQGQFDALIVDYAHLEMMQNRLAAALSKVAANGLSVSGVTATKPFKRNGVAQVAVMFDFSDGQTFTAFFHNPDSTPAKLAPKDILTSWKFTLNKRDVTAVVQPEQGENVQMPKLASRIMQLVAKNSDRFKRANARKGEMAAQVQEVQARIDQKQAQLTELESDIADLQGRIDERLKAKPASAESGGMVSPKREGEKFTVSIPGFGDIAYQASNPFKPDNGEVVSSRVITTKTKITKGDAITLGLDSSKKTVYAWRVSVVKSPDGTFGSVIEAMDADYGRTPSGAVAAYFKEVESPESVNRIAPAIAKAAMNDWKEQQAAAASGSLDLQEGMDANPNGLKNGKADGGTVSGGSSKNPDGLTDAEMVVLLSARGYKSKFRYDAARKETSTNRLGDDGISKDQYNSAVDSLNAKGKYLKRSAITDDGQNLVDSFMPELHFVDKKLAYFAGKFAASEQPEMTDAQKIELVDKAYKFASATDEFKLFAANSQIQDADDLTSLSVEAEYDPLSTAVAMDKAAKKNGFAVNWQIFTEPGLNDELMARVYKGRKQVGRISMGGDGKAMVYVGASGDTRVTTPDGRRAFFSDDDAPDMIDWLANSLSKQASSTVAADQAASQPDSTKPAAAPVDGGLSKDASEAIDNMLLALEADQQLMGRIEQAASRMDITDVSGDMVESWYRANSITYLSSLPMTQLMKAADEFKRQAVETVNRIGTVYGMSDRELYLLAMYLGYAEGTARNPDAVTKKALGEHPADLDKAFAKLKKSPKPQQDDQEAQAVNPPTQEPVMNPDLDYLQSIVEGAEQGIDKASRDRVRQILVAAKDANDKDTEQLANLAVKAIADRVKAAAKAKLEEVA